MLLMKQRILKLRRLIIAVSAVICAVFLCGILWQNTSRKRQMEVKENLLPENLIDAVKKNDYAAVGYLLGQGVDVNQIAPSGENALMAAAEKGYTSIAAALLQAGANPEHSDKLGRHALALAAEQGHLDVIKTILRYRADINTGSESGQTALLAACRAGQNGAVELIMQYKPLLYPGVAAGKGPLIAALQNKHIQTAIILLEYGVNPQERDTDGNTVLHLAVQCGSAELCEILFNKYNIDPSLPNNSGQSAADLAQKSGNEILKKLFAR